MKNHQFSTAQPAGDIVSRAAEMAKEIPTESLDGGLNWQSFENLRKVHQPRTFTLFTYSTLSILRQRNFSQNFACESTFAQVAMPDSIRRSAGPGQWQMIPG
jgi:hypothetical protein